MLPCVQQRLEQEARANERPLLPPLGLCYFTLADLWMFHHITEEIGLLFEDDLLATMQLEQFQSVWVRTFGVA